jgi:hypothetical protein
MKVQYRAHKSLPQFPMLSQVNPVHTTKLCFTDIGFNIFSYVYLSLPSGIFPSGFPTGILYAFLISMCATCSSHIIFLHLVTLIISGEEYKLWTSVSCECIFLSSKYCLAPCSQASQSLMMTMFWDLFSLFSISDCSTFSAFPSSNCI